MMKNMRLLASLVSFSILTACGTQQSHTDIPTPSGVNKDTSGAVQKSKITLKLVQKKPSSPSGIPHVAPEHGVTQLTLPLYPGAASTSQKFPQAFMETPISWYVRTGSAEYTASVDASHLETWYRKHMEEDGYRQTGSGSTGNFRTGETAKGLVFKPVHQVSGHKVEVDISFENLSDGKTVFEYWGTDLVVPPRPSSSILPGNVTRIDGEMTVYGSKVTKYKVDITAHYAIHRLVSASNSLSKLTQGVNPGGPMIWGTAELTFHTATGKSIPVKIQTDGLSVGGVGLQDSKGTVWKTLESVMGVHGRNN